MKKDTPHGNSQVHVLNVPMITSVLVYKILGIQRTMHDSAVGDFTVVSANAFGLDQIGLNNMNTTVFVRLLRLGATVPNLSDAVIKPSINNCG